MRVLGVAGSLRQDSYNRQLLESAATQLPEGVELVVYDRLRDLPPFDQDDELDEPPAVTDFKRAIEAADAVLFATPEYNSSIPGVLKNAIDWASRPPATSVLRNKSAAVVGASTGMFGAVWAQAELRKVLSATGARVVGNELPVARAATAFTEGGELADETLREQFSGVLATLVDAAELRPAVLAA